MKDIQVKVLNPNAVAESEQLMVAMARMTQHGQNISCMDDFMALYNQPYTAGTVQTMADLPHPTIQKFGVINVVIIGASRRFLGQITRHQNEVKFMSGSLQYSDYADKAQFTVPYGVTVLDHEKPALGPYDQPYKHYWRDAYLKTCVQARADYEAAIKAGLPHDDAGYMMPQGMRNVLLISATPYQWKHMISQRTCRRNTLETQYVMLKCWEALYNTGIIMHDCGAPCISKQYKHTCYEGKFCCGNSYATDSLTHPTDILKHDFKYLYEED